MDSGITRLANYNPQGFHLKTPSRVLRQPHSHSQTRPSAAAHSTPLHPTSRARSFEELGFPAPMAVADPAVKPSLAARIVADPAVKPSPSARIVALALFYLCLAMGWVINAGMTATIVARRACGEGSALLVFLEAFTDAGAKISICTIFIFLALAAVLLFGQCLAYLVALVSGPGSEFKKTQSAFGATTEKPIPKLLSAAVLEFVAALPRAVVLGLVAYLALILLTAAGTLVGAVSPHVEGSISQGEMIGSVIEDVGAVGSGAIACFVIIPGLALFFWRMEQALRQTENRDSRCRL